MSCSIQIPQFSCLQLRNLSRPHKTTKSKRMTGQGGREICSPLFPNRQCISKFFDHLCVTKFACIFSVKLLLSDMWHNPVMETASLYQTLSLPSVLGGKEQTVPPRSRSGLIEIPWQILFYLRKSIDCHIHPAATVIANKQSFQMERTFPRK